MHNKLTVLHQNINGLINKSDELLLNLDQLKTGTQGSPIDVLCITEHNMIADDSDLLHIQNYTLASSYYRKNRHGGSCILIHNNHKFKVLKHVENLSTANVLECSCIELTQHNIIILCVYRVPKYTNNAYDSFFSALDKILHTICCNSKKKVIICGDFNIDMLIKNKNSNGFLNILHSYNMKVEINQPTRLASGTCLDNIFHNITGSYSKVIDFALSDHSAQLMNFPVKSFCTLNYWYKFQRDYSDENINKFRECLGAISFNEIWNQSDIDAHTAFEKFHEIFELFYNLCFPYVKIKMSCDRKPKWISKGIKLCSKNKRNLLWKYRVSRSSLDKHKYNEYSKRLKLIIKQTQKSQNNYLIKTADNKCKMTWKIINQFKSNNLKEYIYKLTVNGKTVDDPLNIAELFNEFYTNIKENNDNTSNNRNNKKCMKDVTKNIPINSNSLYIKPTIPKDIWSIIKLLKNTNSSGHDGITTQVIKSVADIIAPILSHIINLCIEQGKYPNKLKVSIIKPLFKKEDRENMNFYRPIALIPIFSKIFEKVIYNSLYSYLEKFNLLAPQQKGFRQNKTINMAIYDFLLNIIRKIDKKIPVAALYMDLTKAFDHVDYNILLSKLEKYGIRGNVLSLIKSYLTNRVQITQIDRMCYNAKSELSHFSRARTVQYGVPQGSVLGPLLFIIYINDLPKITEHPVVLFADDSTVVFSANNISSLENEINVTLQDIIHWLDDNSLLANLEKTKIMTFNPNNSDILNIDIKYNNNKIEHTNITKFLGLYIDSDLSWRSHSEHVTKKLSQFSYALHKLGKVANKETVLIAYKGNVEALLRFSLIFWGNTVNRDVVFKSQKRCIRAIFKLKRTDSCRTYFKNNNLFTFPSLYVYEVAAFVKSNPNLFERFKSQRYGDRICNIGHKTAKFSKNIFGMAPAIYNKIPNTIRQIDDLNAFKLKLKKYLINKAYYSINEFLLDIY